MITISETSPDPDEIVEPARTLPFHLGAIPSDAIDTSKISTVVFQDPESTIVSREEL